MAGALCVRREMCEGRRPADASRARWAAAAAELRRREAAADAQLAAARARLAEALAELERARARAAELQRRLEQTYGKRRRLVKEAQGRIHEIRACLRHHQDQAGIGSMSSSSSSPPRAALPPRPRRCVRAQGPIGARSGGAGGQAAWNRLC